MCVTMRGYGNKVLVPVVEIFIAPCTDASSTGIAQIQMVPTDGETSIQNTLYHALFNK
ncbi:MAG: hypothetical protein ACE5PM_04845 [Candidatus Hydrothermarchaeales archaeon]